MGVRSTTVTASLALLLSVSLTSCTADEPTEQEVDAAVLEVRRAADALSVTILRPGAERAFARKGHPVAGPLTCAPAGSTDLSDAPSAQSSEELAADDAEGDGTEADGTEGNSTEDSPADEDAQKADSGQLAVLCTGHSRDGEKLRFEGQLSREALSGREVGDDSLRGAFTGLVGDEEVFSMDCFQCAPVNTEPAGSESESAADETDAD